MVVMMMLLRHSDSNPTQPAQFRQTQKFDYANWFLKGRFQHEIATFALLVSNRFDTGFRNATLSPAAFTNRHSCGSPH
jgi:hypothetical protein